MDVAKFLELVKHFEQVAPEVLKETEDFVTKFGPLVTKFFPAFAGAEKELEAALHFLSQTSGTAFKFIDQIISVLATFQPKA